MSLATVSPKESKTDVEVRPFRISVREEAIVDLRRRIAGNQVARYARR